MIKSQIARSFLTTLLVVFASCTTNDPNRARTISGVDIGKRDWRTISDKKSIVYILDAPSISRIRANEGAINRYQEYIRLSHQASIFYEKLYQGVRTRDGVSEMLFQTAKVLPRLESAEVTINRDDIKEKHINGINYAYAFKTGISLDCFVIFAFFGEQRSFSEGDQIIRGEDCRSPGTVVAKEMEEQWFNLLDRIRFDGPKPGWTGNTTTNVMGDETVESSDLVISDHRIRAGQAKNGKPRWRPGSYKTTFTIGKDEIAFFFIKLIDLNPGQKFSTHWKFYAPDGSLQPGTEIQERVSPGSEFNLYYTLNIAWYRIGKWRVDFEYNGYVIKQKYFHIL